MLRTTMSTPTEERREVERVIVIGASAGGVDALMRFVSHLSRPLPAPILIALHIGAHESALPQLLERRCNLDVAHARNGEPLRAGVIRIAPPDGHLMLDGSILVLSAGPKENYARPAIDPLFRSAAIAYGSGAIGVVLTGRLDDGTAGLQAIKARGGIAVVQDPVDAVEPGMPSSALIHVSVDHCVALQDLAELLTRLTASPVEPGRVTKMNQPSDWLEQEQALSYGDGDFIAHIAAIGTPSSLTCPECHGGLWSLTGAEPPRFRCHTGHAFTERTLAHALTIDADAALWNALRTLHERQMLARKMVGHLRSRANPAGVEKELERLQQASSRLERQISTLRSLVDEPPEAVE